MAETKRIWFFLEKGCEEGFNEPGASLFAFSAMAKCAYNDSCVDF